MTPALPLLGLLALGVVWALLHPRSRPSVPERRVERPRVRVVRAPKPFDQDAA